MWLLMLLLSADVEQRHAEAANIAQSFCRKLAAEQGLPCKVDKVVFSSNGNEYIDHAVAFITVIGDKAALSIGYRYGKWYIESFDVEKPDAGN